MKSSAYRTVAALLGIGSFLVFASGPSPRTTARTATNLSPSARTASSQSGTRTPAQLAEIYGKVPLSFEANRGQTDPSVKFLSRGSGYTLFLTGDEAVLSLRSQKAGARSQNKKRPWSVVSGQLRKTKTTDQGLRTTDVLRMKLMGANRAAKVTALDELPGKTNYFIGNDPRRWRTDVPTYAKVKYAGVYPGIDLIYYGNQRQLEYDFVVAAGADPKAIQLAVVGAGLAPPDSRQGAGAQQAARAQQAAPLRIDGNGDLVVETDSGEVRFHKPVVYQEESGVRSQESEEEQGATDKADRQSPIGNRKLLDGRYVLTADNQVRFEVPGYDKTKPLVIDPTLVYSTYLGGSNGDSGNGIAVDSSGNAYVTGGTVSTDFPSTANVFQAANPQGQCSSPAQSPTGCGVAFVTKFDAAGTALVYSTYLGGSTGDNGLSIAVDSSGNAWVTGSTGSANFPVTANAFEPTLAADHGNCLHQYGPCTDGFVTKLSAAGNSLIYSTFLGGNSYDNDQGNSVAVDSNGNAYVTGSTTSCDFPTTPGAFQSASPLVCGGGGGTIPDGNPMAFVAKFTSAGQVVYSTYFDSSTGSPSGMGDGGANGVGIAADSSGNAYVTGWTNAPHFPTTSGAFQTTCTLNSYGVYCTPTAFVTKFNPSGSGLVYSTFLGAGIYGSQANGIAADASGNAYVTGNAGPNFPTVNAFQPSPVNGSGNPFVAKLNAAGSALIYSTYLGGSGTDVAKGIAVDSAGNAYVTGSTQSTDFPTLNAFQSSLKQQTCTDPFTGQTYQCGQDAFVTELNATGNALYYSSYLGGTQPSALSGGDVASGIAVDSSGNAYVTGRAVSTDFPTVNAFQSSLQQQNCTTVPCGDAFVSKVSAASGSAGTPLRITSFTPTSGPVGTTVTITGSDFTTATGIAFNGTSAAFTAVSDTQITATVPSGATVGPISVSNSTGKVTSVAAFTELPAIASFSPTSGILGTAVTITGTSFTGATAVKFSGSPYYCDSVSNIKFATFTVVSDTQISTSVPSGAATGIICVTNNGSTAASSSSFTVKGAAPPTISSFSPTSGTAGTPVTITGSHFTGTTAVAFNGAAASFSVISDTQITAWVPTVSTATTGPITVTNSAGTGSTSTNFSVTPPPPTVTGFSPANGPTGTTLTITGSFFTGTTSVTFGGTPASFTVVSDSQITATVPGGAINSINYYDQINCIIIVTTPWGRAYVAGPQDQYGNRTFFEVLSTAPPTISSFSPTTAAAGSRITLNGANFTGAYWVSFTGAPCGGTPDGQCATSFAAPTGISDTQLTITVPFYAQSGPITVYNTAGSVTSSASFTATSAPPMTLSPLSATFGNQVVGTTSSPQTFTVTNHTGSAINMGGIVIGGSNSSDYSHAGTCSPNSPVAAGGSCTIDVTFTPTATGTRAATLQVGFSASNSPQVASLTGTGTSSSGGGGGSGPAVVQVQNNIDVSGAAYASFSVPITTKAGDLLVAFVRESSNGTDNFTVTDSAGQTWTQTASGYKNESNTGPRVGMFYMANSAAVSSVTVNYSTPGGVIKPGIMVMEISGAAVADGSVNGGTAASTTTSTSGGLLTSNANDLLIFATDASGNESGWTAGSGYAIPNNKVTTGASGSDIRMAMQYAVVNSTQTYTTGMTYTNSNWNGNIFAAFKITSASADPPAVSLSPTSLNFGNQNVGTTSAPQTVTLSNIGTATLSITSIGIENGDYSSDFAETNNCGTSLAAGASCAINVTFTPPGDRSDFYATLGVTDNAAGSPQTANLTGGGLAPEAVFGPGLLVFSNQQLSTTSAPQTATITNTGNMPLSISSVSIAGTNPGDFGQTNNCPLSPSTLAVNASCTFNVTFKPTATGTRSAALTVTDNTNNHAGTNQTVSLTGTGCPSTGCGGGGGSTPAVVQVQNNIDVSGAAFASFSVPITTNSGDLLVAFVRESSNGTDNFTVTDSAGQTWTQTASGYNNESNTGPRTGMFYVANSAAVTSVTVRYSTSGGVIKPGIMVMEISGAAISGVLDGSVNHGTPSGTTTSTSGSLTTTNANDILIFAADASGNETGWTPGTGYAIPTNKLAIGASGSNVRMAMQVAVVSSVQTNTTTGMSYANSNWNGNIFAAFK